MRRRLTAGWAAGVILVIQLVLATSVLAKPDFKRYLDIGGIRATMVAKLGWKNGLSSAGLVLRQSSQVCEKSEWHSRHEAILIH